MRVADLVPVAVAASFGALAATDPGVAAAQPVENDAPPPAPRAAADDDGGDGERRPPTAPGDPTRPPTVVEDAPPLDPLAPVFRPRLAWDPRWQPVRPWEVAVAFGFFGTTIVVEESISTPTPRLTGAGPVDRWVRSGVVLPSRSARTAADTASDYTLFATLAAPLLLDDLVMIAVADRQPSLALRVAIVDLEALAFAVFLGTTTQHLARRTRPFTRECDEDPQYSPDCGANGANLSFFSIHTTMAFTGAGLFCLHHTSFPIFGGGAADAAACGVGLSVAALTGGLRMMADRHWSTDVLTGAAVGLASGWLLPWLLHFRPGAEDEPGEGAGAFLPWVEPARGTYGLRHVRAF